ncbi:AAA family ATPase [Myxococcota bacterium]|nr:AAA family ATPase [Myxococcota bacterium]
MKILRITWQNIHSLRCAAPESIDLEAAPFFGNGLFTITGPTGAGKSTLLDVVCLALYGRTPRFGDNASPAEHVMSWGAGECLAEVDFRIDDQRFRSRWSCHRARRRAEGALQSPSMQVFRLDVEPPETLHTQTKEAIAFNEARIGLKFEHFRRAILLAQGQFAEFLKGKTENRRDILERLTDTRIYVELSKAVHRRAAALAQALAQVRERRAEAAANVLPPPEADALEAALARADGTLVALGEARTALVLERARGAEIARLEAALEAGAVALAECTAQLDALAGEAARLDAHEALDPLAEELEAWLRDDATRARLEEAQRLDAALRPGLVEAVEAAAATRRARVEAHAALRAAQEADEPRWTRVTEMDGELAALRQAYAQADAERRRAQEAVAAAEGRRAQAQAALDRSTTRAGELADWLAAHAGDGERADALSGLVQRLGACEQAVARAAEAARAEAQANEEARTATEDAERANASRTESAAAVERAGRTAADARALADTLLAGGTAEALSERVDALRTEVDARTGALADGEALAGCHRALAALEAEAAGLEVERRAAARAVEDAAALSRARRAVVDALRATHEAQLRVIGALPLRASLVEGAPCPVCGATEHPLASAAPPDADATALAVARADAELRDADAESERRRQALAAAELHLAGLPTRMAEVRARLRPGLGLESFDPAGWPARREALETELAALSTERAALEALRPRLRTALITLREADEDLTRRRAEAELSALAAEAAAQRERDRAAHARTLAETAQRLAGEAASALDALAAVIGSPAGPAAGPTDGRLDALRTAVDGVAERVKVFKAREADAEHAERAVQVAATAVERAEGELVVAREAADDRRRAAETLLSAGQSLADERATLMPPDRTPGAERQRSQGAVDAALAAERAADAAVAEADAAVTRLDERVRATLDQLAGVERAQASRADRCLTHPAAGGRALAALLAARLPAATAAELRTRRRALLGARDEAATRQAARAAELERLRSAGAAAGDDAASLDERERTLADRTTATQAERDAICVARDRHRRAVEAVAACDAEMGERGALAARWDALDALIGSADGRKFATYAQGLNLRHLLRRANLHLARISGRYRLVAGDELRIDVEDVWQNESRRSVDSLSGGETFVVSLALALGLADMASRNVRIDSLFIDEGFGTLDADVLEDVVSALESQVFSGKLVGIISHVEGLKDRIPLGLRVRPRGDGQSAVEVDDGSGAGGPTKGR